MLTRRGFLKATTASAASALWVPRAGLAQVAPGAIKRGGTLTAAIFADPLTFDPHFTGNLQGRAATRAIHDTLFRVNAQGRLAPGLVESWEQPDDKTFVLKLRADLKFHDGTPLDAAAVKYNIDRIRDPKTTAAGRHPRRRDHARSTRSRAVDTRTVKLTLKSPFAAFLFPFTDVTGCDRLAGRVPEMGTRITVCMPSAPGRSGWRNTPKDSRTVLEKNGDYWDKGKPYLDRVVLRPIPTDSTRLAELRAGGVEIAEALPLQDMQRLRQSKEIVVSEKVGYRWEYFGFNLAEAYPGRTKKFRQAFQWAIDREALHQVAYFGTGSIGYDGIMPAARSTIPNYTPFKRDLDKAKKLIAESGIGAPVTIQAPLQPDPVKQRAGQVFQATAAELGVKVKIEQIDSAGYRDQLRAGKMAMDLFGWWGYRPDPDQYLGILLHSSGSYAKYHSYSNPKMDELIIAERAARTEAERRKVFRQISELMNDDAVYVPWHYSSDFKGLHPNVKGFVHAQDAIIEFDEIWLES